jgi:hypothetical protein
MKRSRTPATPTPRLKFKAGAAIKVFTWGHPGTKAGDIVRVTEVFQQVKRVRQYTFYNEIEAQSVTPIAR